MSAVVTETTQNRSKASIPIHAADYEKHTKSKDPENPVTYYVEKADGDGIKRRYLYGIGSGPDVDGHGDNMTDKALDGMIQQASEKDITLYVNHGKDFIGDIGILTEMRRVEGGNDLLFKFRLYDDEDLKIAPELIANVNAAKSTWLQVNGLYPYTKKRQFGFSIEGWVPEDKRTKTDTGWSIDWVDLDPGVAVVPKPAYESSMVGAIVKSLNYRAEQSGKKEASLFTENLAGNEIQELLWNISSAFHNSVYQVVENEDLDSEAKIAKLESIFDDYRVAFIDAHKQKIENGKTTEEEVEKSLGGVRAMVVGTCKGLRKDLAKSEEGTTEEESPTENFETRFREIYDTIPDKLEEIEEKASEAGEALTDEEKLSLLEDYLSTLTDGIKSLYEEMGFDSGISKDEGSTEKSEEEQVETSRSAKADTVPGSGETETGDGNMSKEDETESSGKEEQILAKLAEIKTLMGKDAAEETPETEESAPEAKSEGDSAPAGDLVELLITALQGIKGGTDIAESKDEEGKGDDVQASKQMSEVVDLMEELASGQKSQDELFGELLKGVGLEKAARDHFNESKSEPEASKGLQGELDTGALAAFLEKALKAGGKEEAVEKGQNGSRRTVGRNRSAMKSIIRNGGKEQ